MFRVPCSGSNCLNNQEPRTKSQEPRTKNQEPRTKNQEPRTKNCTTPCIPILRPARPPPLQSRSSIFDLRSSIAFPSSALLSAKCALRALHHSRVDLQSSIFDLRSSIVHRFPILRPALCEMRPARPPPLHNRSSIFNLRSSIAFAVAAVRTLPHPFFAPRHRITTSPSPRTPEAVQERSTQNTRSCPSHHTLVRIRSLSPRTKCYS